MTLRELIVSIYREAHWANEPSPGGRLCPHCGRRIPFDTGLIRCPHCKKSL